MSNDVIYQSKGALIQFIETNMGTITATAFIGDGSLLQNVTGSGGGGGGISWDGSTANGVATFKDADEATVESNLTFDGSTLTVTGDASITGDTTLGNASTDTVTFNAKNITLTNVAAMGGTDNTVLICDGTSVATDEIDSRVWGSTLVDASGTPVDNQVAVWTDANTLEGDSGLTFDGSHLSIAGSSAKLTIEETSGTDYRVVIDPDNGPRIQFGNDTSDSQYMDLGAFSNINNIDTQDRDFHLFGTNTTSGIYFAEALGRVGILTGSYGNPPQFGLDVKGTLRTTDAMQVSGAVGLEGDLVFGAPLGISQIVDSGGNTRVYISSAAHMSLVDRLGTANVVVQDGYVQVPTELHVASSIVHDGDLDTLINFSTDQIDIECGTKPRIKLDGTGIGLMGATPIDGVAIIGDLSASANGVINGALTVGDGDMADDTTLLTFFTDRSWAFKQSGNGSSAALMLQNTVGPNKDFIIKTNGETRFYDNDGVERAAIDNDTGDMQLDGDLTVSGGDITFGSDAGLKDAGGSNRIFFQDGGSVHLYGPTAVDSSLQVANTSVSITSGVTLYVIGNAIADGSFTTAIQFDGSGHVTTPKNPAFGVYGNTNQSISAATWTSITFEVENYDVSSDFASNIFTAPVAGKYMLSTQVRLTGIDSSNSQYVWIKIVTSNRTYYHLDATRYYAGADYATPSLSVVADMDASDTAYVQVLVNVGTTATQGGEGIANYTAFQGALIG